MEISCWIRRRCKWIQFSSYIFQSKIILPSYNYPIRPWPHVYNCSFNYFQSFFVQSFAALLTTFCQTNSFLNASASFSCSWFCSSNIALDSRYCWLGDNSLSDCQLSRSNVLYSDGSPFKGNCSLTYNVHRRIGTTERGGNIENIILTLSVSRKIDHKNIHHFFFVSFQAVNTKGRGLRTSNVGESRPLPSVELQDACWSAAKQNDVNIFFVI